MDSLLSNATTGTLVDLDETPAQPALLFDAQLTDSSVKLKLALPSVNSDGSALTDLKSGGVITAPEVAAGFNPFDGLVTKEQALSVPGAALQTFALSAAEAGTTKDVLISGLAQQTYWFVAYVSDEAQS